MLNPRCSEEDIIEEINLVFREERIRREKSLSRDAMGKAEIDKSKKESKITVHNFILSAVVSIHHAFCII